MTFLGVLLIVFAVIIAVGIMLAIASSGPDYSVYDQTYGEWDRTQAPSYVKLEKKEKKVSTVPSCGMSLSSETWYTIATLKEGRLSFLSGKENDFNSREQALDRARDLAQQYPLLTFWVMGRLNEVKANIPVEAKDLIK